MLATLAAAYAKAGRFSEAVQAVCCVHGTLLCIQGAIHASPNSSAPRFNSSEAGKPYHELPQSPPGKK